MNAIAIILIILMALAILVIMIVDYYKAGEENLAVGLNELLANYVIGVILPIILPLIALWLKEK